MNFISKWNTYQKERFPLLQYIPMVAAFSFCAVSYSAIVRGGSIGVKGFLVAFITALAFFMLLRIADEFKDFEEDSKYRSYRPVPRGLIKLKELAILGAILAVLQYTIGYFYFPKILFVLVIVWIYYLLMSKEFFLHRFLIKHPIIYLLSHMMIMPLIDFYATACDFLPVSDVRTVFPHLIWFLFASFFNGVVIEIGRKIRSEEDEEEGVQTYTVLWGRKISSYIWLFAIGLSFGSAIFAAYQIDKVVAITVVLSLVYIFAITRVVRFLKNPISKNAKMIEKISGIWTIAMYLSLGLLPLLIK